MSCRRDEFTCYSGDQCVWETYRCDGKWDCLDGSDERHCPSPGGGAEPELNLRTYPMEQTIKEGGGAVFQCRDEGPLRARVRWSRSDGLTFPPGYTDADGRLELPQVFMSHMGTYLCDAIDHPGKSGSRISVYLRVIERELYMHRI